MIKVTQERDNIYTVEFDVPELSMLYKIATGYSIPRKEAVALCLNEGFETCVRMLSAIADREKRLREKQEKDG